MKTPLSVRWRNAAASADRSPQDGRSSGARWCWSRWAWRAARSTGTWHARSAAAAHARASRAKTVPVAGVLDGLVRVMERMHAQRVAWPSRLRAGGAPRWRFAGEAQDLQEMLGNLLDNACKWAKHRVEIGAHSEGANLTLTLDDDGPGLDVPQRDAVMRRGVRADEQVPGSGLGLAIVDDLARLYGGRVDLLDSPLGGLRAALTLPAVAERS
jgi:signal transduction histidine kinase